MFPSGTTLGRTEGKRSPIAGDYGVPPARSKGSAVRRSRAARAGAALALPVADASGALSFGLVIPVADRPEAEVARKYLWLAIGGYLLATLPGGGAIALVVWAVVNGSGLR